MSVVMCEKCHKFIDTDFESLFEHPEWGEVDYCEKCGEEKMEAELNNVIYTEGRIKA